MTGDVICYCKECDHEDSYACEECVCCYVIQTPCQEPSKQKVKSSRSNDALESLKAKLEERKSRIDELTAKELQLLPEFVFSYKTGLKTGLGVAISDIDELSTTKNTAADRKEEETNQ